MRCEYEMNGNRCPFPAKFPIYQLERPLNDKLGIKEWRNFCSRHESRVVYENILLKEKYPNVIWKDPELIERGYYG